MKDRLLKTVAFAAVGVFLAYDPAVVAFISTTSDDPITNYVKLIEAKKAGDWRGLEVKLDPHVKFDRKGLPVWFKGCEKQLFEVTLAIEGATVPIKNWKESLSAPRANSNFFSPNKGQVQPEDSIDEYKVHQLIGVDTEKHLTFEIESKKYYIGWTLTWKTLKTLAEKEAFYHLPTPSIDPRVYLKPYSGVFTYAWPEVDDPVLMFGRKTSSTVESTSDVMYGYDDVDVELFGMTYTYHTVSQTVHFDAIKIPPSIFQNIGAKFEEKLKLDNGRYKGEADCSTINISDENFFSFTVDQKKYAVSPLHLFVNDGGKCTLLFEKGMQEDRWMLGNVFLKAFDVSFNVVKGNQVQVANDA